MDGKAAVLGIAGLAVVAYATTGPPATNRAQPAPSGVVIAPPPEPDSATDACASPASGVGRMLLRSLFGLNAGVRYRGPAYDFDVLITTVPDPVDSHLDWAFDSQLEAVRRAFETSGWLADRFWLPPRDSLRRARVPGLGTREACPGVLVFRRADPTKDALRLVYVVGETSNRGVLKPALFNALREREQLLANAESLPIRPAAGDVLRIIGPSFSGSALSLRMALQSWPFTGTRTIEIVSGAATDPSNRLRLTSEGTPSLRYRATVNSDSRLRAVLDSAVLAPMGLDRRSVALLEESSTQYGQALSEPGPTAQGYLRLPFPMGVASLRAAYQRNPDTARDAQTVPGAAAPPRLPLDLIDPVRPKEDLPVTSQLSPAALDIILDQIARTLVDRQIRAVGLLFTDVRDKLVLADELKKRVHDLQLFTFESNVLYLRPDYGQALRGMLVLSTYPLVPANQRWTGARRTALMFSSDGAEGTYNATLYQLGDTAQMLDYHGGTLEPTDRPPVWVTVVGANSFLPVARVGPDAGSDPYLVAIDAASNPSKRQWGRVMGPVGLLPFLAIVFSGFALILLAWTSRAGHEAAKGVRAPVAPARAKATDSAQVEEEGDRLRELLEAGSLVIHERLYTLLRMIALLGVFISTGVLEVLLLGSRDLTDSWWFWILLIVTVAAAGAAIVACTRALARLCRLYWPIGRRYGIELKWGDRGERILWLVEVLGRVFVALFGLAYLLLTLGFGLEVLSLSTVEFKLFFNRAAHIGDLVSPLIPLIVSGVGFAVWASWHLRRIRLLTPVERTVFERACMAESRADRPADNSVQVAFRDDLHRTGRAMAGIRERLFLVMPDPGALVLLAFLLLAGIWLAPQFGHSMEAIVRQGAWSFRLFDWLLWASALSTLFATAWAVYRLHSVWRALRHCLGTLQSMPLEPAFDRLPPRVARLAKLKLPALTRPPRLGAMANKQWQHLRRLYAEERTAFDATRSLSQGVHLPERFASLMSRTSVHAVEPDEPTVGQVTQNLLDLLDILRALWRLEPTKADVDATVAELSKAGTAGAEATMATSARFRRTFTTPVRLWLRGAEEYVAVQVVEYIEWVTRHLRMLSLFLLLSLLLATALFSTYPFQPQALVRLVFFFLLLATVGSILFVNAQMNRNDVLSRIAHTEPGKLTWDTTFVINLITFGVVPLLTILSAALPGLRTALFSWADPLLKVLAKQ